MFGSVDELRGQLASGSWQVAIYAVAPQQVSALGGAGGPATTIEELDAGVLLSAWPQAHLFEQRLARILAMEAFRRKQAALRGGCRAMGVGFCVDETALRVSVQFSDRTLWGALVSPGDELQTDRRHELASQLLRAAVWAGLAAETDVAGDHWCRVARRACPDAQSVDFSAAHAEQDWQALLSGNADVAAATQLDCLSTPQVVFPGAFAPRHAGHRQMSRLAEIRLGSVVWHEISIVNVDKPALDFADMHERSRQFAGELLLFTRAATFVEKAEIFGGPMFVVGTDTIRRIADPYYYGGSVELCRAAIARLAQLGSRFLVFGRLETGKFRSLESLDLPVELRAICEEVPESRFRSDISSRALRSNQSDTQQRLDAANEE